MSRSDIEIVNATWMKGIESGDADMIASVYAPDARVLPGGHPLVTGPDIRGFFQAMLDSGVSSITLKTVALEERDDIAIEEGQYDLRVGADMVDVGKYVVVHRRQDDGSWRLGLDIWNSDKGLHAG